MARIVRDVTWLIGRTPLLDLARLRPADGARILGKLEFLNPGGSNKDRAVLGMVEHAERSGFLEPGGTIIEASAGDTGFALAMICAARRYALKIVLPETVPATRRRILATYGAEVILTPAADGIRGALQHAEELARQTAGAMMMQPFSNRANADIHARTTAREIWEDTDGEVELVVCPVGTGGTAAGCLAWFREHAPHVEVWAVEPAASAVLSGKRPGQHGIPGIGAGFVPEILTPADLHGIVQVSEDQACRGLQELASKQAVLAGPASGAVVHAARHLAARSGNKGRMIVAILPDGGERFADHIAFGTCVGEASAPRAAGRSSDEPRTSR